LPKSYLFTIFEEMAPPSALSNFELMVMLAVIRLDDQAYGVPITREIEETTDSEVVVGSVYAALTRLQERGLIESRLGEATAERGGRAKRYFRATSQGLREVRQTRRSLMKLWKGLSEVEGGRA
jgi:PadR family transcriptional regulator, regulatory protein PadR